MKKNNGSIGLIFLLTLVLFVSALSYIDSWRSGSWAAETDLSAATQEGGQEQAVPAVVAVVGERSPEATVAVPPPEAAAARESNEAPADPAAGALQNAAAPAKPKPSPEKTVPTPASKTALPSTPSPAAATAPGAVAISAAPASGKEAPLPEAAAGAAATGQTPDKLNQQYQPLSGAKQPGAGVPFIDTSHVANETALKAIERNVSLFKDRLKERFSVWLERSARYMEIMKDILREKNIPEELVFLPIVESGFNVHAYSSAKAVGPWQFIAATAKRYGLVIDWWRDERKDPVKSTKAAAAYLKDLYKMFGSWNLALAAYNAGEGRIMKALKRSDADDYWSLLGTQQIRDETKEYVPRYIAATMIAHTPEEYGFEDLNYHEPLEYDEVTIQSPLDIEVIARCSECTVREVRELNPELRRWSTPPNIPQYTIRIPAGTKELFLKNLSSVPKEDRFTVDTYVAKKGDTVKKIARKTGIPASAILAMNALSGIERIEAGDAIKLPPQEKFVADRDDQSEQQSMVRKAVYRKQIGEAKGERKKFSKKSKKGSSKADVKVKSKKTKRAAVKNAASKSTVSKGTAKIKSTAKKTKKVKAKKA